MNHMESQYFKLLKSILIFSEVNITILIVIIIEIFCYLSNINQSNMAAIYLLECKYSQGVKVLSDVWTVGGFFSNWITTTTYKKENDEMMSWMA